MNRRHELYYDGVRLETADATAFLHNDAEPVYVRKAVLYYYYMQTGATLYDKRKKEQVQNKNE